MNAPSRRQVIVRQEVHSRPEATASGRWRPLKLGDVCKLINGRAYSQPELLSEGKYRVLRVGNFFTNNQWYYSDLELDENKYCDAGDLLYAWSASFGPRIWSGEKVIFHYHIWKVIPDPTLIDQKFLYMFFRWDTELIKEQQGTGTTMIHVTKSSMEDRDIPIPPVPEQRRIVAKLESLSTRSKNARVELARIPRLAERYKQAVLRAAYNEAEVEATRLTTLGEVAEEVRNGVSRKPENAPPGIPVLKISAVRSMIVRMDERRYYVPQAREDVSRYVLQVGDLLFTRYNGNPDLVANCGMVRVLDGQLIYPDKLIRVRVDRQLADPEFVEAVSAAPQARAALAPSIKSAAGQHGISGGDLKRLSIPLPSREQQRRIISEIRRAFSAIDGAVAESSYAASLLDRLDQATLTKAFRGELLPPQT
jgi:type I restriction enzyme S subunit